jgi:hypothetical protein
MKSLVKRTYSILIICITLCVAVSFNLNFGKQGSHYFGDALGYYMYLPATFIYHNLKSPEVLPQNDSTIAQSALHYADQLNDSKQLSPKGIAFMQYTYGVALLELPFFAAAHVYELTTGGHPNGFTHCYANAIWAGNLLYCILGLMILYRILKRYYSNLVPLLTVCIIFLGTNIFWFSVYQYGMSHVPIFFLYSLLILLTIKMDEAPKTWLFVCIGLIIGLIIVIRPTDIVCIFIPLLYNVYNKQTIKAKWQFIAQHKLKLLLLIFASILPVIPQLLYWKMVSGKYIFYSYGQQSFNWAQPKIIAGLFYFSNGWLPYSLVMIFALSGLLLVRHYKQWAWSIFLILPIYIYIIYSWYCFNYINGLGSRPMIHMYPLLAIPLAAFIHLIGRRGIIIKVLFSVVILFMISVNYSFSMLKAKLILNTESANILFCKQVLFKNKMNYNDLLAYDIPLKQPDTSKLSRIGLLDIQDYEGDSLTYPIEDPTNANNHVYEMKDAEYMPDGIKVSYSKSFADAKWLKASGRFYLVAWPEYPNRMLITEIKRGDEVIAWYGSKVDNKIGIADNSCKHANGEYNLQHFEHRLWGPVYYYVPMPEHIQEGDKINVYIWNPDKQEMLIDDLKLEAYK